KLERIAARLTATKKVRESALAELHALADRSAIPAIELILTGQDEDCAKAAIETYRRIAGPESSLALAKQAVFSKWPDVRKSASAELKLRKLEDFVPALTSLLAVPAQGIRHMFLFDASGATLLHSYIVAVETEDQFRVQVFNVVNRTVDRVVAVAPRGMPGAGIPAERVVVGAPYRIPDDLRNLADRLYAQEREQSATDDRIRELNDRVINVLGSISGIEGSTDPRQWWQWWYAFTDTQTAAAKSVALIDEYDTTLPTYVPVIVRVSCFAAGVPVMTESGPRAIESVRIGDRVLSQDIETGELAYKPVVQTTVRPPKELTALRFANETIVCTSGHRFWSSAEGWVKARDLTPQMMLHTVTGNTPVHSAKKVEPAATYNLVIADFHTYFVGQTGLLCQDLIIPRSTNSVLPGLARK
ncbi:MAG TPA: polymorphic toxin-type HINT domain-containing protein, partial [Planctomycetaceae bacterium]